MAKPALNLDALTAEEKLELIDELWESLGPEDFPLTDELRRMLDARLDAMEGSDADSVSWDSVRSEMTPRGR